MKAEIREHWNRVAALGCVVTGGPATIHHAHGASMKERGIHRSVGRKTSPWLVIGLAPELHFGAQGIDRIGVKRWELKYGKQADFLDRIAEQLDVDVWAKAAAEVKPMARRVA